MGKNSQNLQACAEGQTFGKGEAGAAAGSGGRERGCAEEKVWCWGGRGEKQGSVAIQVSQTMAQRVPEGRSPCNLCPGEPGLGLKQARGPVQGLHQSETLVRSCFPSCAAVLEQWCSSISMYFREGEKGAFPRLGPAQLCAHVYPLFCYVSRKRRCCEEEEVSVDALAAVGSSGVVRSTVRGAKGSRLVAKAPRAGSPGTGGCLLGSGRMPGPFDGGGWGCREEMLSVLASEPFSPGATGKGKPPCGKGRLVSGGGEGWRDPQPLTRRVTVPRQVKQAVLRAMGAMMGVLLHVEEHREHAWEHLLWLLHQYREVWDPSGVTVVRHCAGHGVARGHGGAARCRGAVGCWKEPGPLEQERGNGGPGLSGLMLEETSMAGGPGGSGEWLGRVAWEGRLRRLPGLGVCEELCPHAQGRVQPL